MNIKPEREIPLYLIGVLVISFLLQLYVLYNGGLEGELFKVVSPLIMYVPALAAVILLIISKQGLKYIDWKITKPVYLIYGALIPAILALICFLLLDWLDIAKPAHFIFIDWDVEILKGRFVLGKHRQSIFYFLLNYSVTAIIFSIMAGILAFGEELGWRGYLQKKMITKYGRFKSIIFLGAVWGYFHLPYVSAGYNYPETPWLGALVLLPLLGIFISFFLAWVTIRSGSFWPAVITHGSINAFFGSIVLGMEFQTQRLYGDLIIIGVWLVVALIVCRQIKLPD
jgi:uncharacterized protein